MDVKYMYYSGIKEFDISNGPGIRTSLYVSGCTHCCKGCFNEETWNFHNGEPYTDEITEYILEQLKEKDGLSLLGGDPLDNLKDESLYKLISEFRGLYPDKNIWLWTGYTYEEIIQDETLFNFFTLVDVVVDGRFVEHLKDINLKFKGSINQRVIDVKQSLEENRCVILEKYNH
jgi:anaerobic ribonucleoside-triphosphate reductase activating protein